jgi:hypothetical protein
VNQAEDVDSRLVGCVGRERSSSSSVEEEDRPFLVWLGRCFAFAFALLKRACLADGTTV